MKYAVVTGSSRGLGESIIKLLMEQEVHVIGIARNSNVQLKKRAAELSISYEEDVCDLTNPSQIEQVFTSVSNKVFSKETEAVYLINNAAMVDPIDISGNHSIGQLTNHVHVNLLAPMITTNLFLEKAMQEDIPVIITNVTSGAANRAVYGWSNYCSTKAGLDRFTETVATEQNDLDTKNKVILFNPGIMDTEMQGEIRSSNKDSFKDVDTFIQYKNENNLRDTDEVANVLVRILSDTNAITNGKNYSVKDYM